MAAGVEFHAASGQITVQQQSSILYPGTVALLCVAVHLTF